VAGSEERSTLPSTRSESSPQSGISAAVSDFLSFFNDSKPVKTYGKKANRKEVRGLPIVKHGQENKPIHLSSSKEALGDMVNQMPNSKSLDNMQIPDIYCKFILSPLDIPGRSESPNMAIERYLREGSVSRVGRQVLKDGMGNKKIKDTDVWFSDKIISRLHADIWNRNGMVTLLNCSYL
jgi:hypothetical protein